MSFISPELVRFFLSSLLHLFLFDLQVRTRVDRLVSEHLRRTQRRSNPHTLLFLCCASEAQRTYICSISPSAPKISMCLVMNDSTLVHFLVANSTSSVSAKQNQKCTKLETKVVLKVVQFGEGRDDETKYLKKSVRSKVCVFGDERFYYTLVHSLVAKFNFVVGKCKAKSKVYKIETTKSDVSGPLDTNYYHHLLAGVFWLLLQKEKNKRVRI